MLRTLTNSMIIIETEYVHITAMTPLSGQPTAFTTNVSSPPIAAGCGPGGQIPCTGTVISDSWRVFLLVLHGLGQVLSLGSNGSIVAVILRTRRLHTPSCVPILALALSDMLLALVWDSTALAGLAGLGQGRALTDPAGDPLSRKADDTYSGLLEGNPVVCGLVGTLWQTLLSTSTLCQAVVACDRYLFIVHPLRYEVFVTTGRVAGVVLFLPLVSLVLPLATVMSGNSYTYLPPSFTCISHLTWYILFLALVFLPSLAVTLASNAGIWLLCLRQLKRPAGARLIQQMPPVVCGYNLEERNGRVRVRRDTTNEISCCCINGLRLHSEAGEDADANPCLSRLVKNSTLLFVEGLFATVPSAPNAMASVGGPVAAVAAAAMSTAAQPGVAPASAQTSGTHRSSVYLPPSFIPPANSFVHSNTDPHPIAQSQNCNTETQPDLLSVHLKLKKTSSAPPLVTNASSTPTALTPEAAATSLGVKRPPSIPSSPMLGAGAAPSVRRRPPSLPGSPMLRAGYPLSGTRPPSLPASPMLRAAGAPPIVTQPPSAPSSPMIGHGAARPTSSIQNRRKQFLRANTGIFLETRSLGTPSPKLHTMHNLTSRQPRSDGSMHSIRGSAPALHVDTFEMLELPVRLSGSRGNSEMASFLPLSCPSPISARSFNLSSASSSTPRKLTPHQEPVYTPDPVDSSMVLTAVVNPIVGWMMHPAPDRRRASAVTIAGVPSTGSCLLTSLGVGVGVGLGRTCGTSGVDVDRQNSLNEEDINEQAESSAHVEEGVLEDLEEEGELEEEVQHEVSVYRRAKAALLVTLPVVSLAFTVLPIVITQMPWAGGWSISPVATAVVTHLTYVLLPSLNPFLMGMTNRHFRQAVAAIFFRRQELE